MLDRLTKTNFPTIYIWTLFVIALAFAVTETAVTGAVLFGCIGMAALILFSDTTLFLVPVMLLSVFVTPCHDSYSTFIRLWPFAFPLAGALAFHLVRYKKRLNIGPSFWGLIAVTAAVTLGGAGTISPSEYFSPSSLFYVFMLGGGMVLLYLIFSSHITEESKHIISNTMYAVGLLAAFMIAIHYIENWQTFISGRKLLQFQPANNLCTFIMLAMPFPFHYARKRHFDVLIALFMYICMVFSSSRGGLIMGTAEIFLLFLAYAIFFEKNTLKKVLYFCFIVLGVWAVILYLPEMILKVTTRSLMFAPDKPVFSQTVELARHYLFRPTEPRAVALKQCFKDFYANPVFGVGIGYSGNTDIYSPVSGAMHWYHLWTAQIIGSMGSLGIIAYGYQLISRIKIYFKNKSPLNMTFFMSYAGLWMMSQINPGEFCPIPYALIAVIYFILIENEHKNV